MGYLTALDLSEQLDIHSSLRIHLQGNHYPPVPASMVQPCIDAIDAYHDEDYNREIQLPEGVSWRGQDTAPASAIADAHHLDAWLPHAHYCDCNDCIGGEE
jgi:hypothetical protein